MTKTADLIDIKGNISEGIDLPSKLFENKGKDRLIATALRVYLSNQRKAKAKTKTRSEINKTTGKMYKQKGTGRARHGAYSAPIFVGGGVAHGPTGGQNYRKQMTKKNTQMALVSVLADKATKNKIKIFKEPVKFEGKTKEFGILINKLLEETNNLLVVLTTKQDLFRRAFMNFNRVTVVNVNQLNSYLIFSKETVLFSRDGWNELTKNNKLL